MSGSDSDTAGGNGSLMKIGYHSANDVKAEAQSLARMGTWLPLSLSHNCEPPTTGEGWIKWRRLMLALIAR